MSKILIVDDDQTSLLLLEKMLEGKGNRLLKARNGREGLEIAFRENPDLIILDVVMPDIDGFELTRRVKKDPRTKNTPIILVTVLNKLENEVTGIEAGAEEFLNKPVHPLELQARVNSMLRLKQYRDQLELRTRFKTHLNGIQKIEEDWKEEKNLGQNILIVEDNEVDIMVITNALKGQDINLEVVRTGKETLAYLENHEIDLLLLDILLPDMDGFEICRMIKSSEEKKDVQVVIVTCLNDLESKIKGIELGADDFLVKPIVGRELLARIKVLLEKKAYLDKLRSHYVSAVNSAQRDWLTGLYNHGYFKDYLKDEAERALVRGFSLSLIMIDVDDFKKCNDLLGHSAGDAILRELGQILRNNVREVDVAARYGGEEFAIVLPYADKEIAKRIAERIQKAILAHDFFDKELKLLERITVSMGVAAVPQDASGAEELIERADEMLYRAKQSGKNRVIVSP